MTGSRKLKKDTRLNHNRSTFIANKVKNSGGITQLSKEMWIYAIDGWSFNVVSKKAGITGCAIYDMCLVYKEIDEIRVYCSEQEKSKRMDKLLGTRRPI